MPAQSPDSPYREDWKPINSNDPQPTKAYGTPVTIPYFSEEEIRRRQAYTRSKNLYTGEHLPVFFGLKKPRFHYVVVNWLGDIIPATWSRLLFANFPEISAPAEAGDGAADAVADLVRDLQLSTLCRTSAIQASWAGDTVWKVTFSKAQQRVVVRQVDPESVTWEPDPDDAATPIGASYWYTHTATIDGKQQKYLIEENQRLVPRTKFAKTLDKLSNTLRLRREERVREHSLVFTYHAYQCRTEGVNSRVEEVPLEMAFPNDTAPQSFELPLDVLTLIYIPNKQSTGDWRGDTDFTESLISIQGEVNDRVSLNKHILDAHSKPTLLIPDDIVTDGMVRVEDLDWLTAKSDGTGRVMYVEWSGEMGASFTQLDWLWNQFNAEAGLSTTLSAASNALTGRAKELELVAPVAEVRARRLGWEDALQLAIYIAMCLEKANKLSKINPVHNARVVWPTVLPDSRLETAQVTQILKSCGAISVETSIRLNNPTWSDAEVAKEIERIKGDDQDVAAKQSAAAEAQVHAQMALAERQHQLQLESQENQARLNGSQPQQAQE